jgi:hypothetical protein
MRHESGGTANDALVDRVLREALYRDHDRLVTLIADNTAGLCLALS